MFDWSCDWMQKKRLSGRNSNALPLKKFKERKPSISAETFFSDLNWNRDPDRHYNLVILRHAPPVQKIIEIC